MSTNTIPMKTAADAFLFLARVYRGLGTYHSGAGRPIAQRYIEVGRDLDLVAELIGDLTHFPARAVLAGFSVQRHQVAQEMTAILDEFVEPAPPDEGSRRRRPCGATSSSAPASGATRRRYRWPPPTPRA